MIDEKKIEEAADKECGGLALAKEGFKAGINWYLNNLWHYASEEPKDKSEILIEGANPIGKRTVIDSVFFIDWKILVKDYGITRWLHIDDLMKGGNNG